MSSKKKNRLLCKKCGGKFRSKTKKKEWCDECIRKQANSKIIKRFGDKTLVHA